MNIWLMQHTRCVVECLVDLNRKSIIKVRSKCLHFSIFRNNNLCLCKLTCFVKSLYLKMSVVFRAYSGVSIKFEVGSQFE